MALSERELIRKAVFESIIDLLVDEMKAPFDVFIVYEDGEQGFLPKAYKGANVQEASDCLVGETGVTNKLTGKAGVLLEIRRLTVDDSSAEVFAGQFTGTGVMYSLNLKKYDGDWRVVERIRRVIAH